MSSVKQKGLLTESSDISDPAIMQALENTVPGDFPTCSESEDVNQLINMEEGKYTETFIISLRKFK